MTTNKPSSCITTGSGCTSATNYPQFIDTGYCLCGLVNSRVPSRNGNLEQLWRCIGDANEDVNGTKGDHGEWYYPQYPSADLSGVNQPQNWNNNPPDTKTPYVLAPANSNTKKYVTQATVSNGQDPGCSGVNNTKSSAQYYTNSKNANANTNMMNDASSSTSETTIMVNTVSSFEATVSPSSAASTSSLPVSSAPSTTGSSSPSSATPTPGNQGVSVVPSISLKSLFILGVLAVPAIVGLA